MTQIARRTFISGSALAAVASVPTTTSAQTADTFTYDIARTDAQWRTDLTEFEYAILREGKTEAPKTSPLWNETRSGTYACKACDLPIYDSAYKVVLDKGWVFFHHPLENSSLTSIDFQVPPPMAEAGMVTSMDPHIAKNRRSPIETHCRRCGSHMGHVLIVDGPILHCINGTSLTFYSTDI
jgi:peptide-methionine (R)-S-oxide reductase